MYVFRLPACNYVHDVITELFECSFAFPYECLKVVILHLFMPCYLPCMVWSLHHLTLCSPPHLVAPLDSTVHSSMGRTWWRGPVPVEGAWMQLGYQRCGTLWVELAGVSKVACWCTLCCFLSFLSLVPLSALLTGWPLPPPCCCAQWEHGAGPVVRRTLPPSTHCHKG